MSRWAGIGPGTRMRRLHSLKPCWWITCVSTRSNNEWRNRKGVALKFRFPILFVLTLVAAVVLSAKSQSAAQQAPAQSTAAELQARMNAAAAAQQSGDTEQVAAANKRLLAIALYRLAEVRSAEG